MFSLPSRWGSVTMLGPTLHDSRWLNCLIEGDPMLIDMSCIGIAETNIQRDSAWFSMFHAELRHNIAIL